MSAGDRSRSHTPASDRASDIDCACQMGQALNNIAPATCDDLYSTINCKVRDCERLADYMDD